MSNCDCADCQARRAKRAAQASPEPLIQATDGFGNVTYWHRGTTLPAQAASSPTGPASQPEGEPMSSSELAKRLRKGERWKLADEPSQPEGMGSEVPQPKPEAVGEECWFAHLDALVDIWEDGNYNAPEDRCYVPGALKDTMLRAKAAIAANRTALTHPSTPKTAGPREGEPLTDGELTKKLGFCTTTAATSFVRFLATKAMSSRPFLWGISTNCVPDSSV